jgi:hypothetical protein
MPIISDVGNEVVDLPSEPTHLRRNVRGAASADNTPVNSPGEHNIRRGYLDAISND